MQTSEMKEIRVPVYCLVMGVSGSGKSAVASHLASSLGGVFLDADDYHPRANVQRMQAGQPLEDEHRWPWLAAVAEAVKRAYEREDRPVFLACSALKRRYRDLLRERLPGLRILFLDGSEEMIHERMSLRQGHYMPAGMLRSQFEALERPDGEQDVVRVDIGPPMGDVVQAAINGIVRAAT